MSASPLFLHRRQGTSPAAPAAEMERRGVVRRYEELDDVFDDEARPRLGDHVEGGGEVREEPRGVGRHGLLERGCERP